MPHFYSNKCFGIILFIVFLIAESLEGYGHFPWGCYVQKDGEFFPVESLKKGKAQIRVDDKLQSLRLTDIVFERDPTYCDGMIVVIEHTAYATSSTIVSSLKPSYGKPVPIKGFIDLKLMATEVYESCYAVIFSGTEAGLAAENLDELFVSYASLGKLEAGKPYETRLSASLLNRASTITKQSYFIAFFDAGKPILSEFNLQVHHHFSQLKRQEHNKAVELHLEIHRNQSVNHSVFYSFVPYLPERLYSRIGNVDTKVVITIDSKGKVTVDSLSNVQDREVCDQLSGMISEWLFLPKLENGNPVTTRTATKVQF